MRLIKTFGLAALVAMATMAFLGNPSASAATTTQLCGTNSSLTCGAGNGTNQLHLVLAAGTVLKLLAAINILCLGELLELDALGLGNPQPWHSLNHVFTGCGTGSTHNNCTISIPAGQQPLYNLLKTGFDEGVQTAISGQMRLVCSNIGLDCLYDLAGMEFEVAAGHVTANETSLTELGGKFFCPDEGLLDALWESLLDAYVLQ